MKYYAVIVAGGSGSRMKTAVPKQFLLLKDRPVLMHTIEQFSNSDLRPEIILALHPDYHSYWAGLCLSHHFGVPHRVVEGGSERFYSVKNAISEINADSVVAIHDAVRPLASNELITKCYRHAEQAGTAIPVVSSRDSLRKKEAQGSKALIRDEILIVQTPQVFKSSILKNAYRQSWHPGFTDDASVVEMAGETISLVEGESRNIKITYPEDILVASVFLQDAAV